MQPVLNFFLRHFLVFGLYTPPPPPPPHPNSTCCISVYMCLFSVRMGGGVEFGTSCRGGVGQGGGGGWECEVWGGVGVGVADQQAGSQL
jgi:hypothetical protein